MREAAQIEHEKRIRIRAFEWVAIALALSCLGCGSSDAPQTSAIELSSGYTLDPGEVPEGIRHLVPLATQWGIGDDVERREYVESSTEADRDALSDALASHHAEITAWLDSFEPGAMSGEAAAFMYMQLALEQMH